MPRHPDDFLLTSLHDEDDEDDNGVRSVEMGVRDDKPLYEPVSNGDVR
jgi:hypothetical protein